MEYPRTGRTSPWERGVEPSPEVDDLSLKAAGLDDDGEGGDIFNEDHDEDLLF